MSLFHLPPKGSYSSSTSFSSSQLFQHNAKLLSWDCSFLPQSSVNALPSLYETSILFPGSWSIPSHHPYYHNSFLLRSLGIISCSYSFLIIVHKLSIPSPDYAFHISRVTSSTSYVLPCLVVFGSALSFPLPPPVSLVTHCSVCHPAFRSFLSLILFFWKLAGMVSQFLLYALILGQRHSHPVFCLFNGGVFYWIILRFHIFCWSFASISEHVFKTDASSLLTTASFFFLQVWLS